MEGWPGSQGYITQHLQRTCSEATSSVTWILWKIPEVLSNLAFGGYKTETLPKARTAQEEKSAATWERWTDGASLVQEWPRAAQREGTAMQDKLSAGSKVWGRGWETGIIMITSSGSRFIFKNNINPEEQSLAAWESALALWPPRPLDHAIRQHQEPPFYRRLSITQFSWEHPIISGFVYGNSLIWRRLKSLMSAEETAVLSLFRTPGTCPLLNQLQPFYEVTVSTVCHGSSAKCVHLAPR